MKETITVNIKETIENNCKKYQPAIVPTRKNVSTENHKI